ncbi:MAG: hypothetical protein P1U68_18025 [Verrucomicrobiales bacterium]|nr:hypothetical protein [Verrucomicrobiales bacterium]
MAFVFCLIGKLANGARFVLAEVKRLGIEATAWSAITALITDIFQRIVVPGACPEEAFLFQKTPD